MRPLPGRWEQLSPWPSQGSGEFGPEGLGLPSRGQTAPASGTSRYLDGVDGREFGALAVFLSEIGLRSVGGAHACVGVRDEGLWGPVALSL